MDARERLVELVGDLRVHAGLGVHKRLLCRRGQRQTGDLVDRRVRRTAGVTVGVVAVEPVHVDPEGLLRAHRVAASSQVELRTGEFRRADLVELSGRYARTVECQSTDRRRRHHDIHEIAAEAVGRRREGVLRQELLGRRHQHHERVRHDVVPVLPIGVLSDKDRLVRGDRGLAIDAHLVHLATIERRHRGSVDGHGGGVLRRDHPEGVATGARLQRHRQEFLAPRRCRWDLLDQVVAGPRVVIGDERAFVTAEHRNRLGRRDHRPTEVPVQRGHRQRLTGVESGRRRYSDLRARGRLGLGNVGHVGTVFSRQDGELRTQLTHQIRPAEHDVFSAEHIDRQAEVRISRRLDAVQPVNRDLIVSRHLDAAMLHRAAVTQTELRGRRDLHGRDKTRRDGEGLRPRQARDGDDSIRRGRRTDEQRQGWRHAAVVARERDPKILAQTVWAFLAGVSGCAADK